MYFLSFFTYGEIVDLDTFLVVMKKLEICFAYVDLYVRLVLDTILPLH